MILYHCLPRKYLTEQIKGDKFYSYHDRQPYAKKAPNILGIWCCDNAHSAIEACMSYESSRQITDLALIKIDTNGHSERQLNYQNCGNFVEFANCDYYILREKEIPVLHITVCDLPTLLETDQ